jgi:adenosine deaminase
MNKHNIVREDILKLPKSDLHCHLDGSLRLATLVELAREYKVELPTFDEERLRHTLLCGRRVDSLESYLKAFAITLMVLQDKDALARVAFELAEDAAKENVWYLEVRFSPLLHTNRGLRYAEIVDAVLDGLQRAQKQYKILTGLIICGMRDRPPAESKYLAEVCVAYKNKGVVGFDLAGAEMDNPAKDHQEAFTLVLTNNINCTIHAGEAYGPASIAQAIHYCGTHRIGHGTRLIEDGDLLNYVNDHRIPLEICLTSNLQTNSVRSLDEHPFRFYFDYKLRVTLNTDNRLMSATTSTDELWLAAQHYDLSMNEVKDIIIHGFKSAFLSYRVRKNLLEEALKIMDRPIYPE